MFLKRVLLAEMTPEDLDLIMAADRVGDEFNSILSNFVMRLWEGSFQLFRFQNGCLLTEVHEGCGGHKRLNILRFAGDWTVWHFEDIARDLQHIARDLDCEAIETMVYCPKLTKALTRVGARQEAVNMILGVE